jgi:glutathione S-transferase
VKLFYYPGACSLADHIALEESGAAFEVERVDLKSKKTESGADFLEINPKGYVPALLLDSGEVLTENIAILDWVAAQNPSLGLDAELGRTWLLQTLAYISTEVHKGFEPMFIGGSDEEKEKARHVITHRLEFLAERATGPFLFGPRPTVADCYLFVMVMWSMKFGVEVPGALIVLRDAMLSRPAVQKALAREGLRVPVAEASAVQNRAAVA